MPLMFAEVIIPIPTDHFFTYSVPKSMHQEIRLGQRVLVSFGEKKILTGIVYALHRNVPSTNYRIKPLLDLLDKKSVLGELQFKLYRWISNYYMCTLGETLRVAIPSGLRLSSESKIQINPSFMLQKNQVSFSEDEYAILERLKRKALSFTDITKLVNKTPPHQIIKSLIKKEAVILFESVQEKYRPKIEKYLRLDERFCSEKKLQELFETLNTKPKQEELLLFYINRIPLTKEKKNHTNGLARSEVKKNGLSEYALSTLVKKEIFHEIEVIVPRYEMASQKTVSPTLSEAQKEALKDILQSFQKNKPVLLQGVTGSGKTEIYIALIHKTLAQGNQALLLIPEIALTSQIVTRLKKSFDTPIGVYHSKFSDNERVEIWNALREKKISFIVGARSAVFLPFDNLRLIIVDEEHEPSYKQQDPSPRYHARDVALMMGKFYQTHVILGSATPSAESYFHTLNNHYTQVIINQRYGLAPLAAIELADIRKEQKRKTLKGKWSSLLLDTITDVLKKDGQVLIFHNRRGYAPMAQCDLCNHIAQCIHCSVSLTYHRYHDKMICHYCGYYQSLPMPCAMCGSQQALIKGYGTEKIEEELKLMFEDIEVQRMDRDTVHTRRQYEKIIADFDASKTHILVGTQMIAKGLDFDNVGLVGVFDADHIMHFPDFRSHERAFQLIIQSGGRAGRRDKQGKVIVQTSQVDHPLWRYLLSYDVQGFLNNMLKDRHEYGYPPYTRLVELTLKDIYSNRCQLAANELARKLRASLTQVEILGPGEAPVMKIRNEFLMTILIKIKKHKGNLTQQKEHIKKMVQQQSEESSYRSTKIIFNVDPV